MPGFDFINNDTHANDDNFHGTHVASVIAESTGNALGRAGLAYNTAIMPVKVLDADGVGDTFSIAEGIDFAAEAPNVKVIDMSLGGEGTSAVYLGRGHPRRLPRASRWSRPPATRTPTVGFPANLPNVIAVGAVDGRKQRAPYSNFGSALDLVAPGGNLDRDDTGPGLRPDGRPDGILQQTSTPTPRPSSAATTTSRISSWSAPARPARTWPRWPRCSTTRASPSPAAIQKAIESTAEDLGAPGRDDQFGHGLLRPAAALTGLGLNR